MTRISKDIYRTVENDLIVVSVSDTPPKDATVYIGYDYQTQYWVFEGKKDTRTLSEIMEYKKTFEEILADFKQGQL